VDAGAVPANQLSGPVLVVRAWREGTSGVRVRVTEPGARAADASVVVVSEEDLCALLRSWLGRIQPD
jgi:hypothetical protein